MTDKFPSFKAMYGHAPVAGQDYDPDGEMSQDDYEFYMGTGNFSDDFLYDLGKNVVFDGLTGLPIPTEPFKVGQKVCSFAAAPGAGRCIHEVVRVDEDGTAWGKTIENTMWVPDGWC